MWCCRAVWGDDRLGCLVRAVGVGLEGDRGSGASREGYLRAGDGAVERLWRCWEDGDRDRSRMDLRFLVGVRLRREGVSDAEGWRSVVLHGLGELVGLVSCGDVWG